MVKMLTNSGSNTARLKKEKKLEIILDSDVRLIEMSVEGVPQLFLLMVYAVASTDSNEAS